jgi:hypothetical protein
LMMPHAPNPKSGLGLGPPVTGRAGKRQSNSS